VGQRLEEFALMDQQRRSYLGLDALRPPEQAFAQFFGCESDFVWHGGSLAHEVAS
jgi:hypothetical protein